MSSLDKQAVSKKTAIYSRLLFTAQNHKNIVVTQRGHMTMTCLVQKEPKSENLAKCFGESKSGDITDSIYR